MKKLFYYTIPLVLCFLLFWGLSQHPTDKSLTELVEAKTNPYIIGASVAAGVDCPTGTYLFAWDGDYTIGGAEPKTGCFTNGTVTKVGDLQGGAALHTDWGEGGSIGMGKFAANDYLEWVLTDGDGIVPDASTVYVRMNIRSSAAGNYFFEAIQNGSNYISMRIIDDPDYAVQGEWQGVEHSHNPNEVAQITTWLTVGFSWQVNVGGNDFAVYVDDGVIVDTWYPADKDIAANWADPTPTGTISIGPNNWTSSADNVWFDQVVIISGWQAALPAWW